MESIFKYDRVVLVKELNDKFKKVGEVFEACNILDDSFLLREAKTRIAVGIVSYADFKTHFVREAKYKNDWTQWVQFNGYDGQNDCFYKTNRKDVEVKFVTDKVRAKSFLHKEDEFNLSFGIQLAYLRCLNKALEKKRVEHEEALKKINGEIIDNKKTIQKMLSSLDK